MRKIARVFAFGLALCAPSGAQSPKPKVVDNGTVIEEVTLISPEQQAPLEHATVVIREGRIAEIGTSLVAGPHAKRLQTGLPLKRLL
jgi:hypothetical protein